MSIRAREKAFIQKGFWCGLQNRRRSEETGLKHKVDGSRLKAVGFSPPAPATSNEPEEEKFKNRRAELTKQQEGQSLEKAGLFSRWRDANASNFLNSNFQIRVTGVSTSKLSKAGLFHVLYYLEAMAPVTGII